MDSSHTVIVHRPVLDGTILTCTYSMLDESFTNSYEFPAARSELLTDDLTTRKLCEWVAIITVFGLFSVEYFDLVVCEFDLTTDDIEFFEKLIFHGFGEFRYVNHLPMDKRTRIQSRTAVVPPTPIATKQVYNNGPLLLNGGGKDGSVSALLLTQAQRPFTWFQRGDSTAQSRVVAAWNSPLLMVKRNLDPNRTNRRYSGHRPMSAGIAFVATLAAHLYGYTAIIASNEASANEGNATFGEFTLNHQYSKSLEFERDIQRLLTRSGVKVQYFSLLRPLHELQIALIAAQLEEDQLHAIISCNNGTRSGKWCMACAKCAFVALVMSAASPDAVSAIWGDKDVINQPSLHPYLVELLDPTVDKPLECVGTLQECQLAARLIINYRRELLDSTTLDLLERFATADTTGYRQFLTALHDSQVPDDYAAILARIKEILAQSSTREYPPLVRT